MTQGMKEWHDMAVMDLKVAKHLDTAFYPKPIEIICFHCQQAAEILGIFKLDLITLEMPDDEIEEELVAIDNIKAMKC